MSSPIRVAAMSAAAVLAVASQAFAHAHLVSAAPADKASVAAPSELDLNFTEALNLKFSGVSLTGPNKKDVALGEGMLMDGDKALTVPVPGRLPPGLYRVQWHALSTDGHKTNGNYSFTVPP